MEAYDSFFYAEFFFFEMLKPKAVWNGVTLAESSRTEVVDGNHYFPPNALNQEYFRASDHQTVCGWKGTASYYDVIAQDDIVEEEPLFAAFEEEANEPL